MKKVRQTLHSKELFLVHFSKESKKGKIYKPSWNYIRFFPHTKRTRKDQCSSRHPQQNFKVFLISAKIIISERDTKRDNIAILLLLFHSNTRFTSHKVSSSSVPKLLHQTVHTKHLQTIFLFLQRPYPKGLYFIIYNMLFKIF